MLVAIVGVYLGKRWFWGTIDPSRGPGGGGPPLKFSEMRDGVLAMATGSRVRYRDSQRADGSDQLATRFDGRLACTP
jgi:hypothetical protein